MLDVLEEKLHPFVAGVYEAVIECVPAESVVVENVAWFPLVPPSVTPDAIFAEPS
jgi:hypothetical protein